MILAHLAVVLVGEQCTPNLEPGTLASLPRFYAHVLWEFVALFSLSARSGDLFLLSESLVTVEVLAFDWLRIN